MTTAFVIQNQHGHYINKQGEWVDGRDRRVLFRTVHRDEAVNLNFELSSKDIYLRAQILDCEIDSGGQPMVEAGPEIMVEQTPEREDADGTAEHDAK